MKMVRPALQKETADKATAYSKKHGLRPWGVYEKAINLLIEQDENEEKEE